MGLSVAMFTVFLIPIDIYSVSGDLEVDVLDDLGTSIKILYYVLYGTMLAFAFAVIPFTYFFFEEFGDNVTFCKRVFAGLKYTIFSIIIICLLFIAGLFVQGKAPSGEDYEGWIKDVFDAENRGDSAILFALSCATLLGLIPWFSYSAYGLSALPIGWLKGKRNLEAEAEDLEMDLQVTRQKRRAISASYLGGDHISRRDRSALTLLSNKEDELSQKKERLEEARSCWNKCLRIFRPFKFVLGLVFLLLSLVIVGATVMTLIERIVYSDCGIACGFSLSKSKDWFNPLDTFLVVMSKFFPLDYIVVGILVVYIYLATFSGISKIGIRALWINLYKVSKGVTRPQGMLLATLFMMFTILALNLSVLSLFPQYATFGSQQYLDSDDNQVPCSLTSDTDQCTMTQIATIVNRVTMKIPFFGIVFYFSNWVFVACYLLGFIVALCVKKKSNVEGYDSSDSDF
eukprot:CAMPEP_0174256698 /NCGR_PEP_ID=MMETSP0439-20130205/5906_1 /TAXON_ID=0 /ORGANISM="Stereomyxa ramosa, Strain Chinc5" /LENGTH=457 /DNA_ID=CAMNT_0015339425 /DNA_START=141 /DNA_END=1514 /DNA_ORIENTATION=-